MIIDERSYILHPGKVPEYFKLYEAEGLPVQRPILGNLIGYFQVEVGTLNQVVHLWGYDSMGERERRRAQLVVNPDWQAYLKKAMGLIVRMENRILTPAPFSPMK
jgi:hypothetical protein